MNWEACGGKSMWPNLKVLSYDLSGGIEEHYRNYHSGQSVRTKRIRTNNKKIKNDHDGRGTGAVQYISNMYCPVDVK
jgi:hypothetical protein